MTVKRIRLNARRGRAAATRSVKGEVGYARPPKAHQFQRGQSGNPNGRPKGAKNESTILRELLHRKVEMREGGRIRKVSILEAIHLRIAEDSLKGNTKSATFLLNRYGALVSGEASSTALSDDDEKVLQAFIDRVQSEKRR